ncbi:MAG: DUF1735 and LamG domain-containing protein [Bacteroides sp.]|uniref:DUF1735 and LamG domain-containing protein n=1 Tax=Bacteroides sp. TaxID=29523 RepID=UPI00258666E3|nr:DUF1735 and LamG domain-containing protein [Bacteroides sp.]MBS5442598.1 DUF1735 and LamG domain-containing protein [Bacteroides sp.]
MRYLVKNKNTIMFAFAILLCAIIASCEDAKYDTIGSRIYLAESSSLSYESKKVTVAEEGSVVTVTPRSGQIATEDIEVTLGLSPKSLEVYNTKSGTNYKSMPEGSYSFDQKTVVIKKGELVAPTVKVTIDPLTKEMLDSGDKFALPVAITAVSGGQQTLEGADVMIYIMDQVIITSAPVLTGTKPITMEMRQDYTVTQWSLEMRINMSELGDGVTPGVGYPGPPSYQNQAIFSAGPGNGIAEDGEIYIRFGDGPIPGNILQIKTQGTQVNAATKFKNNQWYHLAFVCDGVKLTIYVNGNIDATLDLPRKPLRLVKNSFGICNGDWMVTDAIVSEVRFWTTAISQSQIQNNMFAINPGTDGLEAYWKLNEGAGTEFKDATGHGNKATAPNGVVRWVDGISSDGK